MATQLATPSPIGAYQGGGGVYYDYWKYRGVRGTVQIRLLDITPDYGVTFTLGQIHFTILDSTGKSWGSHWVNKSWGVMGAWQTIGSVPLQGISVRLRTMHTWSVPVSFTAEMQSVY